MKIRYGFVSNSSSSSFCLFGVRIGDGSNAEKEALELIKNNELSIEYACNEYDDSVYVGLPPESIKDDETFRQFKDRVMGHLTDKDSKYQNVGLSWITDGGYNG